MAKLITKTPEVSLAATWVKPTSIIALTKSLKKPLPSTNAAIAATTPKPAAAASPKTKQITSPLKAAAQKSPLPSTRTSQRLSERSAEAKKSAATDAERDKFQQKFKLQATLQKVPLTVLQKASEATNSCVEVEEIEIKSEPEDETGFEEVAIDGTELKSSDDQADSTKTFWVCKVCENNVCFPLKGMYDLHMEKVHAKKRAEESLPEKLVPLPGNQLLKVKNKSITISVESVDTPTASKMKPAAKSSPSTGRVELYGYYKDTNGHFYCKFCRFNSDKRSTVASHASRKHQDLLIGTRPRKTAAVVAPTETKNIDEDDESSWPVDTLEEDDAPKEDVRTSADEGGPDAADEDDEAFDAFEERDADDASKESAKDDGAPVAKRAKRQKTRRPGEKDRKCKYCDFVTCKKSTMTSHLQRRHYQEWSTLHKKKLEDSKTAGPLYDELTKCKFCQYKTFKKHSMSSHVWRQHQYDDSKEVEIKSEPLDEADTAGQSAPTAEVSLLVCPYCPFDTFKVMAMRSHIGRAHKGAEIPENVMGKQRELSSLSHTGYACQCCTFVAATVASMRTHRHREHAGVQMSHLEIPSDTYDCDVCEHKSSSRREMQHHIKESHYLNPNEEGMFACHACSYETLSRMGLQRHLSIKHYSKVHDMAKQPLYDCTICDFKTYNKKILEWHKLQHELPQEGADSKSMNFCCNDCDFATWNKRQLYAHINRKHKESALEGGGGDEGGDATVIEAAEEQQNQFACGMCEYVGKNKHVLKVHVIRRHTDNYSFSCELCGKQYKIKADLTNHMRFQHREQPIVCDVCGKTCRNSNLLYLHQKFAHYKPDFECPICRKRVVSQANLDEHILKQHEMNQEVMCEECGKVFRKKARLKLHMRVHTGAKPYTCNLCNRSFARRNGYRQHLLIHTGQKMYICDICGKTFTQKTGLICHRKSHPGDHPPLPKISIDHVLTEFFEGKV